MLTDHRDGLLSSNFCLIFDSSVSLWVGIQSAGDLVPPTSHLWILHSAKEYSLLTFDSKITCFCQSNKITKNKHINTYLFEVMSIECHQVRQNSLKIVTGMLNTFFLCYFNWFGIVSAYNIFSYVGNKAIALNSMKIWYREGICTHDEVGWNIREHIEMHFEAYVI